MPRQRKLSRGFWTMLCYTVQALNRLMVARARNDRANIDRATKTLERAGIRVTFNSPEDPVAWAKQWRDQLDSGSDAGDDDLGGVA